MQNLSLDKQVGIFINEAIGKRIFVSIVFAIVSVSVLLTGVYWPKKYESRTSILWSNRDSLSPLLRDGVAQTTTLSEQAAIAREVIFSNRALDTMIRKAGFGKNETGLDLDQRHLELLKGELRNGIRVHNRGRNLIIISYRNKNPDLAYLVVSILSELLIQETRDVKNKSSQDAFDFINRQVEDYKFKLDSINRHIIDFRKENVDLDSDTSTGVNIRVNELKRVIRETTLQLTEARVQGKSLKEQRSLEREKIEHQLLVESQHETSVEREGVYDDRLRFLQESLDTLRLSYTESYPDIIQLKEQIRNLKILIEKEKSQSQKQEGQIKQPGRELELNNIVFVESPLYTSLSSEISSIETQVQTLRARISDTQQRLDTELKRANKVNALESQLEEMTRDLDVTQQIYDDLLTRRENARVSLNLQLENQGSTFKIQEPAVIPLVPTGLRFLHFFLLCGPAGLLIPLGLIYSLLFIDPRIRHEDSLDTEILGIPVIGAVEHYANDKDHKNEKRKTILSITIAGFAIILLAVITFLKLNQFIGV